MTQIYGFDTNQIGNSEFSRFAVQQEPAYYDGLVLDIIVNERHPDYAIDGSNIGAARIRLLQGDRSVQKEQLNWISPIDSSIQEYPLKNETVLVFRALGGKLWYTKRINTTNKITESSWPGLEERMASPVEAAVKTENMMMASKGGVPAQPNIREDINLGKEFIENPIVRKIRPNEGDLLVEGRYGNTIRFGSNLFSDPTITEPLPNLLISVGQTPPKEVSTYKTLPQTNPAYATRYEDINEDLNSFWIVSSETVRLIPNTATTENTRLAHLRSSEIPTVKYDGAQIFLNSDRLILNSKKNEISLFSSTELNLSAIKSITIDTEKSIYLSANNSVSISSPKIFIGNVSQNTEPMVLGNKLYQNLNGVVSLLNSIISVLNTVAAGATTPLQIAVQNLQQQVNTRDFLSDDNFVSKINQIIVVNNAQKTIIKNQLADAKLTEKPFTLRDTLRSKNQPRLNTVLTRPS